MSKQANGMIHVNGKKWFQESCGNTYHTVEIFVNDEILKSDITYGYGNQYKHTAMELLLDNGYDVPDQYGKFVKMDNIEFHDMDVKRKKDL